ncbi:hypothetical protein CEXT_719091 [Caerostris extrusa]|uniref:LAGLIDADG homing endonuclease n=1 Tax=Caerostris extrusa TaxID=172846 RepID=A0AAV4U462_CAEEX|nr:hypothetical protein CEXT_719091 [Caerostris extrusa]
MKIPLYPSSSRVPPEPVVLVFCAIMGLKPSAKEWRILLYAGLAILSHLRKHECGLIRYEEDGHLLCGGSLSELGSTKTQRAGVSFIKNIMRKHYFILLN